MPDHEIFTDHAHCCTCLAGDDGAHEFDSTGCEWCDDTIHLIFVADWGAPAIGLTDFAPGHHAPYISAFL